MPSCGCSPIPRQHRRLLAACRRCHSRAGDLPDVDSRPGTSSAAASMVELIDAGSAPTGYRVRPRRSRRRARGRLVAGHGYAGGRHGRVRRPLRLLGIPRPLVPRRRRSVGAGERKLLNAIVPLVTTALRRHLAAAVRDAADETRPRTSGPAVIVLDDRSADRPRRRPRQTPCWSGCCRTSPGVPAIPAAAYNVAAQVLAVEAERRRPSGHGSDLRASTTPGCCCAPAA